jgi:hypothetical protein
MSETVIPIESTATPEWADVARKRKRKIRG